MTTTLLIFTVRDVVLFVIWIVGTGLFLGYLLGKWAYRRQQNRVFKLGRTPI